MTKRLRTAVVLTLFAGFVVWPGARVGAQPDEGLPDDDGAPPEEYEPSADARTAQVFAAEAAASGPMSPPVDNAFPISGLSQSACNDSFGDPRSGGRTHMGVDCFAPLGTPLVAVEDGWIRTATLGGAYDCTTGAGDISGNRVSIRGRSGYVYYYGHLDSIALAQDRPVVKGQVIGTVGSTGNACDTDHVHFEVQCGDDGDPFDPYPVMATWGRVTLPPQRWPSTEALGGGVVFSGSQRQDLFALQCGEAIRQKTLRSSGGPSAWLPVPGLVNADPDAASSGPGAFPEIVVRGTNSAIYHLAQGASGWGGTELGGICTSGPTAVYSGPSRLDVFCRGTDRALYQRAWFAGVGWLPGWFYVGGIVTADPDAASPGGGAFPELFVRGTDDAAYQLYWDGAHWNVVYLGGVCTSGPSATYSGPARVDVFCRGTDMAIWHLYWLRQSGWSGWERVGGAVISDPEATSPGPGGLPQVFARGLDRRVQQFWWNGSAWTSTSWGIL